jgi:parvulin-like peptidyl-prolyl isomerase
VERIRKYWRPVIVVVGGIFLITIPWVYGGGGSQPSNQSSADPFRNYVAEIDGKPFGNEAEVNRLFRERLRFIQQYLPFSKQSPEQWVGFRIGVIDEIINNYVLGIEAGKAGIRLTDVELREAIEQEMNSIVGPPPAKTANENKNVSLKDFFSALKIKQDPRKDTFLRYVANQYGSYEVYREQKREQVLAERMRARITDQVKPAVESDAKKEAEGWRDSLAKGTPYADVLKSVRQNPNASGLPEQGQESGRQQLESELADAAFSATVGQWNLVQTPNGFYVFQVISRKEAQGPDFERARPAIEEQIRQEKKAAQEGNPLAATAANVDESEVRRRYEKVTLRYLLRRVDVTPRVNEEVEKLRQKHKVTVRDPYYLYNIALDAKKWDEALAALEAVPSYLRDEARSAYLSGTAWERKYVELRTDPARVSEAKTAMDNAIHSYETAMKVGEQEGTQNAYYYLMGGRMYWYSGAWEKVVAAFMKGAEFAGNDDMLLLNFERQIRGLPDVPGKTEAQAKIADLRQEAKEAQQRMAEELNRRLRPPASQGPSSNPDSSAEKSSGGSSPSSETGN